MEQAFVPLLFFIISPPMQERKFMSEKKPASDNEKLLNLMRYWLFGTFVIVLAATLAFVYLLAGSQIGIVFSNPWLWLIWAITAALCVGAYFGYGAYLKNKK